MYGLTFKLLGFSIIYVYFYPAIPLLQKNILANFPPSALTFAPIYLKNRCYFSSTLKGESKAWKKGKEGSLKFLLLPSFCLFAK